MKRELRIVCFCLIVFLLVLSFAAFSQTAKIAQDNRSVQLTYYGHSAFKLVTHKGKTLLLDPWITNPNNPTGKADLASLKRADFILISHGQYQY